MERITTPAERVLRKCGNGDFIRGLALVSGWCGLHVSAARRWTYDKVANGGTGGVIPTKYWPVIIARAGLELALEIDQAEFYFTADELAPKVAAVVEAAA